MSRKTMQLRSDHVCPPRPPVVEEGVLRELRYCAVTPGTRFLRGDVAAAQDLALQRGWLAADRLHPALLALTDRGRRVLAAADPPAA